MSEKRTILIIEDEHTISNFICRALSTNDYKPIPAASGQEGLSLFFSHGPDLVLLDWDCPIWTGWMCSPSSGTYPARCPSSSSLPGTGSRRRSRRWTWGQTTMWSSPSACLSCWPASAPPCAGLTK